MDIVKAGGKLFIITLVAAVLLGAVNSITKPIIEVNEKAAREKAMSDVLPGIIDPVFSQEHLTGEKTGVTSYYVITSEHENEVEYYVIFATRQGDQGLVSVCVGLNSQAVILGVKVVDHSETPGLGANAAKPEFLDQFTGKAGPFALVKSGRTGPNDIDGVTAATHTSQAVTNAVNDAIEYYETHLVSEGVSP